MLSNTLSFFLQLWFSALVFAAPVVQEVSTTTAKPWHYGTGGGILGFIVLVLDIIVWSMQPPSSQFLLSTSPVSC